MHREANGLTQIELAKKIGISQKHLNQLERSKKFPRWEMLIRIIKELKLDISITSNNLVTLKYCRKCEMITTHLDGICTKSFLH